MLARQRDARLALAQLFQEVDVINAPAFGVTAFPHDPEPDHARRVLVVDGKPEPFESQLPWATLANYGNLPVTTLPVGFDEFGLPLAVQVIAAHREDLTAIALSRALANPES
jgi:amidase